MGGRRSGDILQPLPCWLNPSSSLLLLLLLLLLLVSLFSRLLLPLSARARFLPAGFSRTSRLGRLQPFYSEKQPNANSGKCGSLTGQPIQLVNLQKSTNSTFAPSPSQRVIALS